jgi:NAD(P)H-hydrate repair Nnr-like enzyme with NAD(P)H-hydrate dehydratase domain
MIIFHNYSHLQVKAVVPKLNHAMHKGQCGRVAVFGGCIMYTGAPYFAANSALKVTHIFFGGGEVRGIRDKAHK